MSHECGYCGMECVCDGEDHGQPQPEDCEHFSRETPCDQDEDDEEWSCEWCGAAPCACQQCTECGLASQRLCIDDTCRKGPCCCDCRPISKETP